MRYERQRAKSYSAVSTCFRHFALSVASRLSHPSGLARRHRRLELFRHMAGSLALLGREPATASEDRSHNFLTQALPLVQYVLSPLARAINCRTRFCSHFSSSGVRSHCPLWIFWATPTLTFESMSSSDQAGFPAILQVLLVIQHALSPPAPAINCQTRFCS